MSRVYYREGTQSYDRLKKVALWNILQSPLMLKNARRHSTSFTSSIAHLDEDNKLMKGNSKQQQQQQQQACQINVLSLPHTLLKYGIPTLVEDLKPEMLRVSARVPSSKKHLNAVAVTARRQNLSEGQAQKCAAGSNEEEHKTGAILDTLFPARRFQLKSGTRYVQNVSAAPATRQDVLSLHDALNEQLEKQRAKDLGICQIREALYSDCFDEIIRQVTVGCAERGKLLYRVKAELLAHKLAWDSLYESAAKFAVRKAAQADKAITKEKEEVERLKVEVKSLISQNDALVESLNKLERVSEQQKTEELNEHSKKIASLKASTNTLLDRIELFLLIQNNVQSPQQHREIPFSNSYCQHA